MKITIQISPVITYSGYTVYGEIRYSDWDLPNTVKAGLSEPRLYQHEAAE